MDNTQERIDRAPLPTAKELRRRRNPVLQFGRFVSVSWTMWRLARRKH